MNHYTGSSGEVQMNHAQKNSAPWRLLNENLKNGVSNRMTDYGQQEASHWRLHTAWALVRQQAGWKHSRTFLKPCRRIQAWLLL